MHLQQRDVMETHMMSEVIHVNIHVNVNVNANVNANVNVGGRVGVGVGVCMCIPFSIVEKQCRRGGYDEPLPCAPYAGDAGCAWDAWARLRRGVR